MRLVARRGPTTICKVSASPPGDSDAGVEVGCPAMTVDSMSTYV